MTQEMMQRSKLGVLPTWGGGLGGVRTAPGAGRLYSPVPCLEGPPNASPFLAVRDQRPPRLHLGETNCSLRAASQRRVLGRGDFQIACCTEDIRLSDATALRAARGVPPIFG